MHEITPRASPRRPVHPGQHDIGAPRRDLAPKAESRGEVERPPKAQLADDDAGGAQTPRALGIAPDQHALGFANSLQCAGQPHKKGFRAAVTRPRHRLQQPPAHSINASKRAATVSQLNPR